MQKATTKKKPAKARISHTRKPDNLTNPEWQAALRKQIAEEEKFTIKKSDEGLVYGDYTVYSAHSKNTYKVALRSAGNSLNFCTCPDFKTNQLGTCKHIEAVLLKINARPVLRRALQQAYAPAYTSVYLDYRGQRSVKLRIGTEESKKFALLSRPYFNEEGVLKPEALMHIEQFLIKASKLNNGFRCYDDALEFILQERGFMQRRQLIQKEGIRLLSDISKVKLFPYQQTGILFGVAAGRCILADDMGLGKTLQAISATEVMRHEYKIAKAIIVCPTSLKYQWKSEIEKFTENKKICVVEGNLMMRMKLYANEAYDYFIVSYNVAANDYSYLNEMQADMLILDEAQRIKNWRAKTSAKIKRIKTPHALVLTGTPVENNIEELYSLMQIVNPYLLGSLHHFLQQHQITDETGKVTGYKDLNKIGELLKDVMLRRTKKEVLKELPSRMDKNLLIPLTDEQMQMHDEFREIVAKLVHKWKRMKFLREEDRQRLLNNLNMMRMVCDSTYIIDQETNYQTKLDELENMLDEIIGMKEEKVVVFSQWERMTRLVSQMLTAKGIGYQYLHGGIPSKSRQALFTQFNNDPACKVFLSTDAGGVGLNLQAASCIINLDIPWNPAILEQRIGRIYRLGQKKNVSVINLVAKGTIEEKMLEVLKFKKGVAAGILDDGDNNIFLGGQKFNRFMQSVESVTGDIPGAAELSVSETAERNAEKEMTTAPAQPELFDGEITGGIHEPEEEKIKAMPAEDRVIQTGVSFFEQLAKSLSSPESTKQLVNKLTEKDKVSGQTYLKIPVGNEQVIENALQLIGGLLRGLKH
ncbi:DEAD/DEAH box helicase [Agriterribacter sp.]|uniref:DEAD/DEAH box helicase n=1 Tax=Agriterribacter sp. TaxID=2821509 RepID=UPI002C0269AB|nr:DEAD/DEAH box helicase [Agriterribacter sp.]HRP54838.1 DEAD/DEAH box helicase [Agriterribacter sp.]